MNHVENARYNLTEATRYKNLTDNYSFKRTICEPIILSNVPELLRNTGFTFSTTYHVKSSNEGWFIFERENYQIPNFPEGSFSINSSVAYNNAGEGNILLRVSENPIINFTSELGVFVDNYIHRPKFFGFPSKFITSPAGLIGSMFGGVGIGFGTEYMTSPDEMNFLLGVIGQIFFPTTYSLMWATSEKLTKRKIPSLNEWLAGKNVVDFLLMEEEHVNRSLLQRIFYENIKTEMANLTPEIFLEEVYPEMPNSLISFGMQEIRKRRSGLESRVGEALSKMKQIHNLLHEIPINITETE